MVDPEEPSIIAWSLADGAYRQSAHIVGVEIHTVDAPFPLAFALADLVD